MSGVKQLGLFWGDTELYFSESAGKESLRFFSVPIKGENPHGLIPIKDNSPEEEKRLVIDIQKALKEHHITNFTINLSLPTKDIIFRTFTIPWMPPNETQKVVEFEAVKYLPFSLNELSYTFYPIVITQNGIKRLRIIFVAIKKSTLENYKRILTEASLTVDIVEPTPTCLLRTLRFRNKALPKEQYAIVEKEEEYGKITIIADGIPQFVRDFNLRIASSDQEEISPEAITTRLLNEIQISLDYFNRIGNPQEIDQIIFLTSSDKETLAKKLQESLEIDVVYINSETLLIPGSKKIGYLNALGINLHKEIPSNASFDLSGKKQQAPDFYMKTAFKSIDIKSLLPVVAICATILIASPLLSNALIEKEKNKLAVLKEKIGTYEGASSTSLEGKNKELKDKLSSIQGVYIKSEISYLLTAIPQMLPKSVWLTNLSIDYIQRNSLPSPNISLTGLAYAKEANEQFRLVNKFLNTVKENKTFADHFERIILLNAQAEKAEKYSVTRFSISCR
ncbi:MAG: pilus assembly protein PilM [Candidatus Omnitrophica bacterium]|nr:pilus assembly protein PilM [Candidatus Omnitrophota bacterium]